MQWKLNLGGRQHYSNEELGLSPGLSTRNRGLRRLWAELQSSKLNRFPVAERTALVAEGTGNVDLKLQSIRVESRQRSRRGVQLGWQRQVRWQHGISIYCREPRLSSLNLLPEDRAHIAQFGGDHTQSTVVLYHGSIKHRQANDKGAWTPKQS